ncbi:MAG: HAMP domain-containing histidine kinase [Bacteroidales bacterium]|nr:HAMP domain-containing histidine kinase [Bacteroidales bacterium]
MQIYYKKKRWKWLLFGAAVLIITISLWYTNILVKEIAEDERMSINIWANAIQRKANLVNYTKVFFDQIQEEEYKRASLLAEAYRNFLFEESSRTVEFYRQIMENNTTIPIILTDADGQILIYKNVNEKDLAGISSMTDSLKREFSSFEPIKVMLVKDVYQLLYFKESTIFTELRVVLDDLVESFFSEVVGSSASVPVMITDSAGQQVIESGNLDKDKLKDPEYVSRLIVSMSYENDPIEINLPDYGKSYIYYMNSSLMEQIMYYPYIMLTIISVFLFISYLLFSTARKSEQNLVWIGMSKETAHQLGTPLSSIMAWVELLKMKGENMEELTEIEKDIKRLEDITERFSKIGSPSKLEPQNLVSVLYDSVAYLEPRISKKVRFHINLPKDGEVIVPLNTQLFEWVVENVCKNAVDAMSSSGTININIEEANQHVNIDFEDTGKGIHKSQFKSIFNPGFTSKKRGWGLGLSLSRRIIVNYHKGKIFVKSSVIDRGTVIRIVLKK